LINRVNNVTNIGARPFKVYVFTNNEDHDFDEINFSNLMIKKLPTAIRQKVRQADYFFTSLSKSYMLQFLLTFLNL